MLSFHRTTGLSIGAGVILTSVFMTTLAAQSGSMADMPGMDHSSHASMKMMPPGPLGIGASRAGSGTSWLPDAATMRAYHFTSGSWSMMVHGEADLIYSNQGTPRGDQQLFSTNWAMLMAARNVGSGQLQLHAMASAEPFTAGGRGYPLLLQTGESYHGEALKDRQHPHDLFMEIAAIYNVPLSNRLALSLYGAPVGEPASGPVAYMHRASAENLPQAPIAHHWQDATHITFGVATVGLYSRRVKVEGSLFNGREPDDNRYNFDFGKMDSFSMRATWNPTAEWSASTSYAMLTSPEPLTPGENTTRISASIQHLHAVGAQGTMATSLVYGANKHSNADHYEPSLVLEANLQLNPKNAVFGRAESVKKTAGDLVIDGVPLDTEFTVSEVTAGYLREMAEYGETSLSLGVTGTVNWVPVGLEATYGTRTPVGMTVFVRVRPR